MAWASMHEGIWQCNGCDRIYPEYINGCVEDHDPPRSVRLVVEDEDATIAGPVTNPQATEVS